MVRSGSPSSTLGRLKERSRDIAILKELRKDRGTIVCGRTKCGLSIEDSGNVYAFCLKNSLEVKEKVVLGVTIGQVRDLLVREVVGCSG